MADDLRQLAAPLRDQRVLLPEHDYVSPGLEMIMPDAAFPNLMIGDTRAVAWPYLRRWVAHNWYTDRLHPYAGFINRDEAAILYNAGLMFTGKPCLEVGCWRGWSAVHLALATGGLDVVDPLLADPEFLAAVTGSLQAAGVREQVRLHAARSPAALDELAGNWSLIFIDGDHEGEAPRRDALAAIRHAAPDAMVLFHDLASPHVAAGLHELRKAGWHTMLYQTMQIMGVAWRGDVEPVAHVPDPAVCWTLPGHLAGYNVSNWRRRRRPAGWQALTPEDRREAAMLRAQVAEDAAEALRAELAARTSAAQATLDAALAERDALRAGYEDACAQVRAAADRLAAAAAAHGETQAQLEVIMTERAEAAGRASAAHAAFLALQEDMSRERAAAQAERAALTAARHEAAAALHEAEANYQTARAGHEGIAAALNTELAALREAGAEAQRRHGAAAAGWAAREAGLQETLAAQTARITGLEAASAKAAAVQATLQNQLAAQAAQINLLAEEARQAEAEAAAAAAQRAALRDQVASQAQALAAQEASLCAMRAAAQAEAAQAEAASARRQQRHLTMMAAAEAAQRRLSERLKAVITQQQEDQAARAAEAGLRAETEAAFSQQQEAWAHAQAVLDFIAWATEKRVLAGLWRRGPRVAAAVLTNHAQQTGAAAHMAGDVIAWLSQRRTLADLFWQRAGAARATLLRRLCPPHPRLLALPERGNAPCPPAGALAALLPHQLRQGALPLGPERLLRAHFLHLGFSDEATAALASLLQDETGASLVRTSPPASLIDMSEAIRTSPLFDAAFYAEAAGLPPGLDAALHYALFGEVLGLAPSPAFDPAFYLARNADIAAAGLNALLHYQNHGRHEGRAPLPPFAARAGGAAPSPARENIILAVHETSRTGAPILGWNIARRLAERYNLFIITLADGPLTPEFAALAVEIHGPFQGVGSDSTDLFYALRPLFAGRRFAYAVVNSIESRRLLSVCAQNLVPAMLLMHEFGSTVWSVPELQDAFDHSTDIVFSAPVVANSALQLCPSLVSRGFHVSPQGMSAVPASNVPAKPPAPSVLAALAAHRAAGGVTVLGAGSVGFRKGVDLYLATAAAVQRAAPRQNIQFVWVGEGFRPAQDKSYSIYLQEQIERAGLGASVLFLDEVSDLEPLYAATDVFLLASRLDPLPNVTIDAAHRGIPLICFSQASGMADILAAHAATAGCVVPYLDTGAAAAQILALADDPAARRSLSAAIKELAAQTFDMEAYVAGLDGIGRRIAPLGPQWQADAAYLTAQPDFTPAEDGPVMRRPHAAATYVANGAAARRDRSAATRLALGTFDAAGWDEAHPETAEAGANALADFLRAKALT